MLMRYIMAREGRKQQPYIFTTRHLALHRDISLLLKPVYTRSFIQEAEKISVA
jgi:hypothetical protein